MKLAACPLHRSMMSTERPRSQIRALVRDLAGMFLQQMFFWGCDAQSGGNLLLRLGGQRLAREHACGEGSSRWRWQDGTVELHSFCAGWYPDDPSAAGAVFIRGRERFFDCAGGQPLAPGHYDEGRFLHANADEMLAMLRPLLAWLADYEQRIEAAMSALSRTLLRALPPPRPQQAVAPARRGAALARAVAHLSRAHAAREASPARKKSRGMNAAHTASPRQRMATRGKHARLAASKPFRFSTSPISRINHQP